MSSSSLFRLPGSNKPKAKQKKDKRSAGQRWTSEEKAVLFELIEARKSIVESKESTYGIITKKVDAWQSICDEFGSSPGCTPRTVEQLKNWWKNAKSRAKQERTQQRKSRKKTGGGPSSQPDDLSYDAQRVSSIVPEQMEPLKNPYDCDGDGENEVDLNNSELLSPTSSPPPAHSTPIANANHRPSARPTDDQPENSSAPDGPPPKGSRHASKAQLTEAREVLLQMETEEHDIRVTTLKCEQEIAKAKLEREQQEKEVIVQEHQLRMELLRAQIKATTQSQVPTSTFTSTSWPYTQPGSQSFHTC